MTIIEVAVLGTKAVSSEFQSQKLVAGSFSRDVLQDY